MKSSAQYRRHLLSDVVLLLALLCAASAGAVAGAAPPEVQFDLGAAVECRDVTPPEFALAYPDEMIVEARFDVSVRLLRGKQADVEKLVLEITSPEKRLRVVDFAPQTQLESDYTGEIELTKTTERVRSLGLTLGGGMTLPLGPIHANVSPGADVGQKKRDALTEVFKKIPPKRVVLVSGTTNSEHGVFFKIKPSPQAALEGKRQFTCEFAVPKWWRGDWVQVECRATCHDKKLFVDKVVPCGYAKAYLGLYLQGDAQAERLARRFAASQGRAAAVGMPPMTRGEQTVDRRPAKRPWSSRSESRPVSGT